MMDIILKLIEQQQICEQFKTSGDWKNGNTSWFSPRWTTQNSSVIGVDRCSEQETCNISETEQDSTNVTIDD